MSAPSPFDRLSRRSRYEAAAEVVRTHADTDVQLQPQDQTIAEEEPQQLRCPSGHRAASLTLSAAAGGAGSIAGDGDADLGATGAGGAGATAAAAATPLRGGHAPLGGMPSAALSPGPLWRRASSAGGCGPAVAAGGSGEDVEHGGPVGGGIFSTTFATAAAGEEDEAAADGAAAAASGGGGLAAGISGALGGLASLAGLHLGGGGVSGGGGGPFAAAADAEGAGEGEGLGGGAGRLGPRSHRKHRSEKPKKAPLLASNWLKVDFRGMDTIIRVDRHKLMHKLGVQARDLRLLDITSPTPPAILDRDKAIIVNLWHIRAIITLDYCLVVSPDAIADEVERRQVVTFVEVLKSRLAADHAAAGGSANANGGGKGKYVGLAGAANSAVTAAAGYSSLELPFELKVLEVCLDMTSTQLDNATKVLEGEAYLNLEALTRKVSAANLEKARRIKNRLVRLTKNVESVREVLERFLNDDGDMHRLHLTGAELSRQVSLRPGELGRLSAGLLPGGAASVADSDSSSDSSLDEAETAAVEMLLEAYFMQVDHAYNRLQTIHEYIKDTEDLVTIQLDQHRNQLITVDLALTSLTLSCGLMTVVGGYFGMNLDSGLQQRPHLFKAVVLTTTLGALALWAGFLIFLRRSFY